MRIVAIIPARYASTRFPQKPLAPILGKPMILWVAELTAEAVGSENTYVATDHEAIREVVLNAGFQAVMTSPDAMTGTDRIAEAAEQIEADYYINVQGDEPMLAPESITKVIDYAREYPGSIINGYAKIDLDEDPNDVNIPKCVLGSDGRLLYMSRVALPASKDVSKQPLVIYKQVCIYALNGKHLKAFSSATEKAPCEKYEDIEILRFLDMGYDVRMVELPGDTLAVDKPDDIFRLEAKMRVRAKSNG